MCKRTWKTLRLATGTQSASPFLKGVADRLLSLFLLTPNPFWQTQCCLLLYSRKSNSLLLFEHPGKH